MKKKMILPLLVTGMLVGCTSTPTEETAVTTSTPTSTPIASIDSSEVAAGNITVSTKDLEMDDYYLLEDEDPAFYQITFDDSLRIFTEGGTGVILYSYPTCPWCNRAVPVLNEAAKDLGMNIFYVYIYENEMVVEKTEEEWNATLDTFYEVASKALPTDVDVETGEETPVFKVPLVIAVKDGKITSSHYSLVNGFTITSEDDTTSVLTDSQHEELLEIYKELIESIQ